LGFQNPQGEDVPNFPELRELGDLSDGMSLLGLLAFYAPDLVDWTRIATNEPFSMADCLYNLELVHKFCSESLPNNIFHLGLEDIVYMHRYEWKQPACVKLAKTIQINKSNFFFSCANFSKFGETKRFGIPRRFVLHTGSSSSQVYPASWIDEGPFPHQRR
jgi:hypothetical protein